MSLKPWYKIVTPREDLREGKPLDASEFAVHLDQVREGRAPDDCQKPERFFERTYLTKNLTALAAEVIRRLSGERLFKSPARGLPAGKAGATVPGRIHQSTILFAAGRGEALKRFLVEDGAGRDQRFWRLAQALSALYPPQSEENRWVDGVLARKKGLGF